MEHREDTTYQDEHGIQRDVTPWHPETFEEYKTKLAFHGVMEELRVKK